MRYILALGLAVFASPLVHAEFSTGLGLFVYDMNGQTSSSDAKKSLLGPIFYPLQVRYATQPAVFGAAWAPYLEFTQLTTLLIKNETPDGTAKRNFIIVGSPFEYKIKPTAQIKLGPAYMQYEIKGKGGTKSVANGTGVTVFGVPVQTRTSKIFLLQLGLGWDIEEWRLDADVYFSGLVSERYANSLQLTVSRRFGGQSW